MNSSRQGNSAITGRVDIMLCPRGASQQPGRAHELQVYICKKHEPAVTATMDAPAATPTCQEDDDVSSPYEAQSSLLAKPYNAALDGSDVDEADYEAPAISTKKLSMYAPIIHVEPKSGALPFKKRTPDVMVSSQEESDVDQDDEDHSEAGLSEAPVISPEALARYAPIIHRPTSSSPTDKEESSPKEKELSPPSIYTQHPPSFWQGFAYGLKHARGEMKVNPAAVVSLPNLHHGQGKWAPNHAGANHTARTRYPVTPTTKGTRLMSGRHYNMCLPPMRYHPYAAPYSYHHGHHRGAVPAVEDPPRPVSRNGDDPGRESSSITSNKTHGSAGKETKKNGAGLNLS